MKSRFTIYLSILLSLFLILSTLSVAQEEESKDKAKPKISLQAVFSQFIQRNPASFHWSKTQLGLVYYDHMGSIFSWDVNTDTKTKLVTLSQLSTDLEKMRPNESAEGSEDLNTTGRFDTSALVYSNDGTTICGLANNDLFVYNLETGEYKYITNSPEREEFQIFSPDDTKVAYTKNNDLFVTEVSSGKEKRLTNNNGDENIRNGVADWVYQEEFTINRSFWWRPDSASIVYIQYDVTNVPEFELIDHLEPRAKAMTQKFPMPGDENAAIKLGVVSTDIATTTWVHNAEEKDYYIVDAYWSYSGDFLLYRWVNRDQNRLEVRAFNMDSQETKAVIVEEDETWINTAPSGYMPSVIFLEDDSFLYVSERSGFFHIYHHAADGTLINAVTSGDWMVDRVNAVDEENNVVYFTGRAKSPLELNLYKVNLDGSGMTCLTDFDGTNQATSSENGTYHLVANSTIDRPVRMFAINNSGNELKELVSNDLPALNNFNFNHSKIIEIEADDGEKLYAAITLPPSFDESKKYPVLVYTYGGPGVQLVTNRWSMMTIYIHQIAAAEGFIVFTVDNRGSWGRGHAFESKVHLQFGDWEIKDQIAGVKYLRTLPYVDANRVGITGGSYGGYMTLMALFRAPEYFHVGVCSSPGVDFAQYDTIYTEKYLSTPAKNPEGYKASDASNYASGLKGKLLLIHGMMDNNAHVQHMFKVIEALTKAGKQFDLMLYPQEKHGIRQMHHFFHDFNLRTNFLNEHLKDK